MKRSAYTLFEMVLVLALLVLLAGLSIPSIESMYADYRLQAAVDDVGGAWASLRARAIIEGRPYRFAVNGGDFRGAPDDPAFWPGGDTPASSDPAAPLIVQDSLPRGISFGNGADPNLSTPNDPAGAARLRDRQIVQGIAEDAVTEGRLFANRISLAESR